VTAAEAARDAEAAENLGRTVTGRGWVAGGLQGGNLSALDATMRPIDRLRPANLTPLVRLVRPLQAVLDRMAGKAGEIRSYTDTWRQVATGVSEVQRQLDRTAREETAEWTGDAAGKYRDRVAVLLGAMRGTAALATAMADAATAMGEAVAAARGTTHRLLDDLVGRLIDYVSAARAAEGGFTANVMAQATQLVNAATPPIAEQEQALRRTVDAFESQLSANGFAPQWTKIRDWYKTRTANTAQAGAPAPPGLDERGWLGRGGAYLNGDTIVLRPRNADVPGVTIPNNTGAHGFEVGPGYRVWEWEHTYEVLPYDTGVPFDQRNAALVGDAIARNPVPTFDDQPASATGSLNDALLGDHVKTYRVPSPDPARYTDVIVNYTIAGEHRLHEGYVIRYGERDESGNIRLVTYGEGNSPLQHPVNGANTIGVQGAWTMNNVGIVDDVQDRLRQPAR
jgi:hypothetical protein